MKRRRIFDGPEPLEWLAEQLQISPRALKKFTRCAPDGRSFLAVEIVDTETGQVNVFKPGVE